MLTDSFFMSFHCVAPSEKTILSVAFGSCSSQQRAKTSAEVLCPPQTLFSCSSTGSSCAFLLPTRSLEGLLLHSRKKDSEKDICCSAPDDGPLSNLVNAGRATRALQAHTGDQAGVLALEGFDPQTLG